MDRAAVTGLILAGGRGSRMGGLDKGLQAYRGTPLAARVLARLAPQVGRVIISANRNLEAYRALGVSVWPDAVADFAGPLAGFLTGLEHCDTEWLLTAPCDTPRLPLDLLARLARSIEAEGTDLGMPTTQGDGSAAGTGRRTQPAFCLMRCSLASDLRAFVQAGGRRIETWAARQRLSIVPFEQPGDHEAFFNANTADDLLR